MGQWCYLRAYPWVCFSSYDLADLIVTLGRYDLTYAEKYLTIRIPTSQTGIRALKPYFTSTSSSSASAPPSSPSVSDLKKTPPPLYPNSLCALRSAAQIGDLPPGTILGDLYVLPHARDGLTPEVVIGLPREAQVWEIAYGLLPALHGKGIEGALVRAGLGWGEWMGVGSVVAVGHPTPNSFTTTITVPQPYPGAMSERWNDRADPLISSSKPKTYRQQQSYENTASHSNDPNSFHGLQRKEAVSEKSGHGRGG